MFIFLYYYYYYYYILNNLNFVLNPPSSVCILYAFQYKENNIY